MHRMLIFIRSKYQCLSPDFKIVGGNYFAFDTIDPPTMARTPRYIRAGRPYELIIRAREGLPFVTTHYMRLLLESSLARTQRDNKVTICHYLWMTNHAHIIFIPQDPEMCANFYQELQKKIAEYLKLLLGKDHISLWEGTPVLAELGTERDVVAKIAYIYSNPVKANLVDAIDEYPGLSSWGRYLCCLRSVDASMSYEVPWIRQPAVGALPSASLSPGEDRAYTDILRAGATIEHTLKVEPNAWMRAFRITEPEQVTALNAKALALIRANEEESRVQRGSNPVLGAEALRQQEITKPHTPSPRERRVFIITSDNELRMNYIALVRAFAKECRRCFRLYKEGHITEIPWPPGAFRPHLRPLASRVVS